jgi:hypothetical protein
MVYQQYERTFPVSLRLGSWMGMLRQLSASLLLSYGRVFPFWLPLRTVNSIKYRPWGVWTGTNLLLPYKYCVGLPSAGAKATELDMVLLKPSSRLADSVYTSSHSADSFVSDDATLRVANLCRQRSCVWCRRYAADRFIPGVMV